MSKDSQTTSWQPIETAPKDGTWILATTGSKIPFVAAWDEEDGGEWFTFNLQFENLSVPKRAFVPTYWIPIPELPKKLDNEHPF